MRYAALIYTDENSDVEWTDAEREANMQAYFAFGERNGKYLLGGEPLHETSTATTVRVRDGEVLTTDGPFAETKEALGGFYLIDAPDLDTAIEVASEIPGAAHGSVEVRPIMELPGRED